MKLCKIRNTAIAGAVALGFAVSGGSAWAACAVGTVGTIDAQDPFTIHLCATVENTFTTAVDDVAYGNIGVTGWNGESGCLIMATDGTFDESNTACLGSPGAAPTIARIVAEDSGGAPVPGTPGQINITGAFPDQEIRMWFELATTTNEVAPQGPIAGTSPSMWISQLVSETGVNGVSTQNGSWTITAAETPEAPNIAAADTAAALPANYFAADTTAAGALDILMGATIQTDSTFDYTAGNRYESGDYEGTFDVVLFY
ncbi:MAG: hypothetical protein HY370_05700 [Proteobacteria bacterium]|nr:hypothetical protein [Pseudomonadota bacterium]